MRETLANNPNFIEGIQVEVWGTQQRKGQWDKLKL